ncbi:hypothetical protein [Nocardioides caricicola]|uniref:Uncharacterized protein n=1 Tax=Nocardioides caricicola TaxID=634770 RepID=A0ABW0MWS7_9ACTN
MGLRKNKSLLDQASDTVTQYVDQVKPQLETAVASAKDKAGPALADAKAKAGPAIADARAKAAPVIATGAALAAEKVAEAANKAAQAADDVAAKAEQAATPTKKKHRFRKLLLVTGVAAGAAFVANKLRSGSESQNWQSSYTPTPAPPARPVTPNDEGGATPTEAIADQAEAPHPATTPDNPADVVDLDKK